ncbi:MAG: DUF368 domain-containing protein [Lachnospiraceae bacterium]|nr:DUF368 domain-containing protein [Lachnospiraceae bacterium]
MLIRVLGGFLMALADSVPGVSGGTVAFLMGIYDEFINSLNDIVSRDKEKRMAAFKFLIKLGSGWLVGMASAALVINAVFETHIYAISSLFLGFVLFAIPIIIKEEIDSFKGHLPCLVFTVMGSALVVAITYFSKHALLDNVSLKWGEMTLPMAIYLFICAMCAISAMVLPGISGSTLMLVFGVYQAIMTAISGFLHLDFGYFVGLCIFGFGVLTGIFTIVKLLKAGLSKHRPAVMYFVIGMMLGSFYAIIMGPTSLKEPKEALSFSTFNVLFFVIGGIVIIGLQLLKGLADKNN